MPFSARTIKEVHAKVSKDREKSVANAQGREAFLENACKRSDRAPSCTMQEKYANCFDYRTRPIFFRNGLIVPEVTLHQTLLTYFITTPPYRGWQRNSPL